MRWIVMLILVLVLGCGPSAPKSPPVYTSGDVVYHKVDGRKMIITTQSYGNVWYARYTDDMGEFHKESFMETELTDTPVGLEE